MTTTGSGYVRLRQVRLAMPNDTLNKLLSAVKEGIKLLSAVKEEMRSGLRKRLVALFLLIPTSSPPLKILEPSRLSCLLGDFPGRRCQHLIPVCDIREAVDPPDALAHN